MYYATSMYVEPCGQVGGSLDSATDLELRKAIHVLACLFDDLLPHLATDRTPAITWLHRHRNRIEVGYILSFWRLTRIDGAGRGDPHIWQFGHFAPGGTTKVLQYSLDCTYQEYTLAQTQPVWAQCLVAPVLDLTS